MEDHNLEKIFRDKLKNLECHEDLPDFSEIGMFVQPKRSVPVYKVIAAIAVILISICTGSYFVVSEYLRDQAASETFLSENIRLGANNEKKSSINDTPDFLSVSESSVNAEEFGKDLLANLTTDGETVNCVPVRKNKENDLITGNNETKTLATVKDMIDAEKSSQNDKEKDIVPFTDNNNNQSCGAILNDKRYTGDRAVNSNLKRTEAVKDHNFSLGLIASNIGSGSKESENRGVSYMSAYRISNDNAMTTFSSQNLFYDYDHYQPIRFGLTGSFEVCNNLELESGITYTYLRSKFSVLNSVKSNGVQKLHYLGVPLSLNYYIFRHPNFDVYAGAGGEVDFNVKKLQKYNIKNESYEERGADRKPVWSYRIKTGVSVKLIKNMNLYIEPAVAQYFTKSETEMYWTKNKLVFDLNIGIRNNF